MRYEHPHPAFNGKTVEEIADSLAKPGTPANAEYRELLPRTLSREYWERLLRFFDTHVEWCRHHGGAVSKIRCENRELVELARNQYLWKGTVTEYLLVEQHVEQPITHYSPHWLIQNENPSWPTSWWFKFAQKNWGKSRWHMVPDFPPAMLALAGFDLVSTSRWMGDDVLTDQERLEFVMTQRKTEFDGAESLKPEQVARHAELLSWMPYGGELPILDIDAADITDRPEGKDLTQAQIDEAHRAYAETGAKYAVGVTEVWRKITGVTPRWTVTNDRGGLHGLNLPLPPHVRHPYLLRALMQEMKKLLPTYGVAHKVKGESKATSSTVSLDLTAYNKHPGGRGGMWRVPLCAKPKAGSLPQVPVSEHVKRMPWLATLTPATLGSDWGTFEPSFCDNLASIAETHGKRIEEYSLKSGEAVRDPVTNRIRRVRKEVAKADLDLGVTEFVRTATVIREILPNRGSGPSRHEIRLALAGWLLEEGVSIEATTATLMASGGNPEDAKEGVKSTAQRRESGRPVAGSKALEDFLGTNDYSRLLSAFEADSQERYNRPEPEPDQSPPEASGESTPEEDPDAEEDEPDNTPEPPPFSRSEGISSLGFTPKESDQTATADASVTPPIAPAPSQSSAPTPPKPKSDQPSKKLMHPMTLHQFGLIEAKKRIDSPQLHWTTPLNNGVLENTRNVMILLKRKLPHTQFRWVSEVVGVACAFAGVSKSTIAATTIRGFEKLDVYKNAYTAAMRLFQRWKPGQPLPVIHSLHSLKKMCKHGPFSDLIDAIALDFRPAPFDVQERCLIDQSRSSEERDIIHWTLDVLSISGLSRTDPRFRFEEHERLEDVYRCGRLGNESVCDDHGSVSLIPIHCETEVGCRSCRAKQHTLIGQWIDAKWNHDRYVIINWKASTEPVLVEVRDGGEDIYDPNIEEDNAATRRFVPGPKDRTGLPKRFFFKVSEGKVVPWVRDLMKGRFPKSKSLGKVLSMDLLHRIKEGFSQTKDLKDLKQTTQNDLAYRAFPTVDGMIVVLPNSFLEPGNTPMPDEKSTIEHLRLIDAFQNYNPHEVSKEEMISELLHARMKVGEGFDALVCDLVTEAAKPSPPIPKGSKLGLTKTEVDVLTYPFLRKRAMVPVRNVKAQTKLVWYSAESLRDFKKELREAKYGPDVCKPNQCPIPVVQADGTTKLCLKIVSKLLKDLRTDDILAQNSTGKHYAKEEAWAIATERSHGFGKIYYTSRFKAAAHDHTNCDHPRC